MSHRVHIVGSPPTPNGDLHLGHMAGPYLAADIYRRYMLQRGVDANYVISSDDYQTYVDTTAARLGVDRDDLIVKSRGEITDTLRAYAIGVRDFGSLDGAYDAFVARFFERLLDAGCIQVRLMPVLFDLHTGTYPVEAFIHGHCPTCLAPTVGGICETCGHPNSCTDLLGLDTARYEVRTEPRLVLDLERYRPELEATLEHMPFRPGLERLVSDLLAAPLAPFVLSYRTQSGIPATFAGLPDQQINVWGEMYPGHMYFLERAAGGLSASDGYVQFLGFDISYFYAIVHVALHLAAREAGFDWPAAEAIVTNQFYNLGSDKFSTSRGHLVWARDLAREFNADVIRLYLALHGPEYQEASFVPEVFERVAGELAAGINRTAEAFNGAVRGGRGSDAGAVPTHLIAPLARDLDLEHYSASLVARTAMNAIRLMEKEIAAGERGLLPYVPGVFVLGLEPFCPAYADAIRARFSISAHGWDELQPVALDQTLPELPVRVQR